MSDLQQKSRRCWFLHEDITANILKRLPAKSLYCLKFVSKEWCNLVSGREFIALQSKKPEPVSGFFFQETFEWIDIDDGDSITYIPVDSPTVNVYRSVLEFLPEKVVILSSTNGLLCCRSCSSVSHPTLYVCNPVNRQWTSLPWLPGCSTTNNVALVFDPMHDPIDISTDFKLVVVSIKAVEREEEDIRENCFYFDVYSSKTLTWRRLNESCKSIHCLCKSRVVFADGVLYWLTDGHQIVMFDTRMEMPWIITAPLPETEFSSAPEMCVGEWQGTFWYVIVSEHGLQFWVLEDFFTSMWSLKSCTTLDELEMKNSNILRTLPEKVGSRKCSESSAWMDPLAFKDGMVLMRVSTSIYSYQIDDDFVSLGMRKLCEVSNLGPKAMFSPIVVPYSMSLVPLGHA